MASSTRTPSQYRCPSSPRRKQCFGGPVAAAAAAVAGCGGGDGEVVETEARREDRRAWRRGKDTAAWPPRLGLVAGLGFRAGRRERESRLAAAIARVWEGVV